MTDQATTTITPTPAAPPDPGYTTTEFYMSLAAVILGAFIASGLFPSDSIVMKITGMVSSVLAAFGYSLSRGIVKAAYHRAQAALPAAAAVALALHLSACACTGSGANSVACVVQHDLIDCSESTLVTEAPGFLPFVFEIATLLTGQGGTFDWSGFEAALAKLPLKDAACVAGELEASFGAPTMKASPFAVRVAEGYEAGWRAWMGKTFPTGTRVKVRSGATL
jgi:hypothetical protein